MHGINGIVEVNAKCPTAQNRITGCKKKSERNVIIKLNTNWRNPLICSSYCSRSARATRTKNIIRFADKNGDGALPHTHERARVRTHFQNFHYNFLRRIGLRANAVLCVSAACVPTVDDLNFFNSLSLRLPLCLVHKLKSE